MKLFDYQKLAIRTEKPLPSAEQRLIHAGIGMSTEVGEFNTEVKRIGFYDKPLDEARRAHMTEELGDILWYVALAADALKLNLGDIAQENIEKLRLRYPDKFSNEAAEARADKGGADVYSS